MQYNLKDVLLKFQMAFDNQARPSMEKPFVLKRLENELQQQF